MVAIGIAFIPIFARLAQHALAPHRGGHDQGLSPWYAVFPGGAIARTVLGLNLLGDGLRDFQDPKSAR